MSHLDGVCHSVQELDHKQWRDLVLDDREEEEFPPVDGDEVVVGGLQDRGHILRIHRLLFRLKEVVADTPADDTFPVLLQEDVSRVINEEQAVDHLSCNNGNGCVISQIATKTCHFSTFNAHESIALHAQ